MVLVFNYYDQLAISVIAYTQETQKLSFFCLQIRSVSSTNYQNWTKVTARVNSSPVSHSTMTTCTRSFWYIIHIQIWESIILYYLYQEKVDLFSEFLMKYGNFIKYCVICIYWYGQTHF